MVLDEALEQQDKLRGFAWVQRGEEGTLGLLHEGVEATETALS